ncbi:hypothetical protein GWI33_006244 [Rhynchophorus ferrugineus]|uniref:Uncharacterized protein n=1 Tax=Rhynchophorus ferrugineus TaxID=354439 RepID=A0A834IKQ2_RHYFE|nr:hypothetical protein GWI33_006244 [Rhynchophorus ferrugineus]
MCTGSRDELFLRQNVSHGHGRMPQVQETEPGERKKQQIEDGRIEQHPRACRQSPGRRRNLRKTKERGAPERGEAPPPCRTPPARRALLSIAFPPSPAREENRDSLRDRGAWPDDRRGGGEPMGERAARPPANTARWAGPRGAAGLFPTVFIYYVCNRPLVRVASVRRHRLSFSVLSPPRGRSRKQSSRARHSPIVGVFLRMDSGSARG